MSMKAPTTGVALVEERLLCVLSFPMVSSSSTKGPVFHLFVSSMAYSAQELEYSWVPENKLFLDYRIVREILQLFQKVSDLALLPAPSCLGAFLLATHHSGLREARGDFAKHTAPFSQAGRGEVIFDWEFNILKSWDNRRLELE